MQQLERCGGSIGELVWYNMWFCPLALGKRMHMHGQYVDVKTSYANNTSLNAFLVQLLLDRQ